MSTLEEQRRATGRRIVEERKATGRAIVERRTGRADALDINAVVDRPRQRGTLRTIEPRGAIAPQRGRGEYKAQAGGGGGGGGGVAWPLEEIDGTREYHSQERVIQSTDGALFMAIKMPAVVHMLDADGEERVFKYSGAVDG